MQQQLFMIASACLFIFIIDFFNLHTIFINGEIPPFQQFLGDVAINCGCISNSTALDGRLWLGDGGESETPQIQLQGNSKTRISAGNLLMADPTAFFTARVSSTCFSYSFKVDAGQKFVRLHFYPARYLGFRNSHDFFTVKANSFTLLQNFSASFAADELNVKYFVKEFCLSVNESGILKIEFSALYSNSFVFVNGIEIISMPNGLYYTPIDNLGAYIVGHPKHFYYVDNSTALELIQRLNVGGGSILPVEDDTGMFRKWSDDADYVTASSEFEQIRNLVPAITSPFLAPFKIYQTSRILKKGLQVKEKHHFTWKIPVDLGFCYLVRLHLCSCGGEIAEDLSIIIQNVVVETRVDVIRLSGGNGIVEYRDYLVMMKGDRTKGKRDLFISLQSFDELVLGIMKGLEIFKLSNSDNSLASPNPFSPICDSSFWPVKIRNFLVAFGRLNMIMTVLTIFFALTSAAVYQLRQICEHKFWQDKDKHVLLAPNEPSCYRFTLSEILSATRNFDEALVIGKGGFGKVYKGLVSGHSEVLAIKRLKAESRQGAHEFWREIETLSKLRHIHLVPLLGYCSESEEMILVYEYMPRGTIADNIYKARINGNEGIPLTWEQRLRICIGAARGLEYLHTGTQYGIIHRDVKDTNILLDEHCVAKISDFGLSKQGSIARTQDQPSTRVKGTVGYLDPHYIQTHKPSITSDVYAFGVVLLVVLSGRPALQIKFPGEIESLLACFRECMEKGETKEIIDPSIQEEISAESLTKFMEAVENCLHHLPGKRATMAQLVVILENALEKNRALDPSTLNDNETVVNQPLPAESNQPFEFFELQVAPILEENAPSFPVEGNTNKEIKKADLPAKVKVLQSRETDHNITKKPLWWGRPWFVRKNISKKDAKIFLPKDIKSATQNFSEDILKKFKSSKSQQKGKSTTELRNKSKNSEVSNRTSRSAGSATSSLARRSIPELFAEKKHNLRVFTSTELREATNNFSRLLKIGEGGFGSVYKGTIVSPDGHGGDSRVVAIKRLNVFGLQGHKEWTSEVQFLGVLDHPNLVKLLGYCAEDGEQGIQHLLVYEYMPHKSLEDHLFNRSVPAIPWITRLKIILGAAEGMTCLHQGLEVQVIYRDFKPSNILLDKDFKPKISDFGLAREGPLGDQSHVSTVVVGTFGYAAPEYIEQGHLSSKSDLYSFGVVLYEILTGRRVIERPRPAAERKLLEWIKRFPADSRKFVMIMDPRLRNRYSLNAAKMIAKLADSCLSKNARNRPEISEVVEVLKRALVESEQEDGEASSTAGAGPGVCWA